ncbi:MAG: hypothetical protein A2283_12225 [Lentisphaerae bacterium RIFOXYA12_FULL_48_11]|nr:MAG: hypothetical protein A2283_12225 [Lentisphaerae bacterium RIFOXYA12_FULL_48_11]
MESKLHNSEQKYRDIVETISDWIWEVDRNGIYTYISPKIKDLLGYEAREVLGKTPFDLMPDTEAKRVRRLFKAIVSQRSPIKKLENINQRKDGRLVVLETSGIPLFDPNEQLQGYRGVDRDITERKRIEEELKKSKEHFRLIAETIEEVFWMADVKTQKTFYVSPAYEKIWGRSCKSLYKHPQSFIQSIHADDRKRACIDIAIKRSGRPFNTDYRIIRPDGTVRWIWDRGYPVRNKAGMVTLYVGVAQDVTERKNIEKELRQHQTELAHVDRISRMNELATSLAHELNQPLAGILSNAQAAQKLLYKKAPNLKELQDIIVDIIADDERASSIITKARAFAKRGPFTRTSIDVNDTIREALAVVSSDTTAKGMSIVTKYSKGLPNIVADQIQLQQIILNLVLNAAQAMPPQSKKKRKLIISTSSGRSRNVIISVEDNGPGINPKHLEIIFEPFFTTKKHGMGMGLTITKSIVTAHGGKIWAENRPKKGLRISFTLPITAKYRV